MSLRLVNLAMGQARRATEAARRAVLSSNAMASSTCTIAAEVDGIASTAEAYGTAPGTLVSDARHQATLASGDCSQANLHAALVARATGAADSALSDAEAAFARLPLTAPAHVPALLATIISLAWKARLAAAKGLAEARAVHTFQQAAIAAWTAASGDAAFVEGCQSVPEHAPSAVYTLADLRDGTRSLMSAGYADLAASVAALRVPIGVNAPKLGDLEAGVATTHGDMDAILADLDVQSREDPFESSLVNPDGDVYAQAQVDGLGVNFIRQPTRGDMAWPGSNSGGGDLLVPVATDSSGSELSVAAPAGLVPGEGDTSDFSGRLRSPLYWALYGVRWNEWRELFRRLQGWSTTTGTWSTIAHPEKVVFAFLTLGDSGLSGCKCDPLAQIQSARAVRLSFDSGHLGTADTSGTTTTYENVPVVRWPPGPETSSTTTVNIWDIALAPETAGVQSDGSSTTFSPVPLDQYTGTYCDPAVESVEAVDGSSCSTSTGTAQDWALSVLDTRSRYKLAYVYLIAKATATLLVDLEAAFNAEIDDSAPVDTTTECGAAASTPSDPWSLECRDTAVSLFDSIMGIQMGNELNRANMFFDGVDDANFTLSATLWARMAREGARGFNEVLGSAAPLWFASLATYYKRADDTSGTSQPEFADVLHWQRSYLSGLSTALDLEDDAPTALRDLFVNQDYHYYHYSTGQGAGFIGRMVWEVEKLNDELSAAGFTATVSICETGASSSRDDIPYDSGGTILTSTVDYPYPYITATMYIASHGGSETEKEARRAVIAESFQAREVWRRLSVGAASGASSVAWHTHMGTAGSNFDGTGVRADTDGSATTSSTGSTKLAWWALQRLCTLLGLSGATTSKPGVVAVRKYLLSAPAGTLPDEVDGFDTVATDATNVLNMLVIIEFQATPLADYAYLAFVDPCADVDGTGSSQPIHLCVRNGGLGTVWRLPSVPDPAWIVRGAAAVTTDDDRYFPQDTTTSDWETATDVWAGELYFPLCGLISNADPILLLSSSPLEFSIVDITGTPPVCAP